MIKKTIKQLIALRPKQYSKICESMNFVHIPKTAGTSFREALDRSFHLFKDYGADSEQTSGIVKQYFYGEGDLFTLKGKVLAQQNFCIVGHTPLMKYVDYTPIAHTLTFVREPLAQVISHYNHHVKYHGYTDGFDRFIDKPLAKNIQSRVLKFMPLGLLGYIGLTEYYEESLALINSQFGLELSSKSKNVNKNKALSEVLLSDTQKAQFLKNNQKDITLYEEAKFLHLQRLSLSQKNMLWTYGCAVVNQHRMLHGCAYSYQSDKPVTLAVHVNGKLFNTLIAKDFYGAYTKANFPRSRYIGFNIALPKGITSEDLIDIYVEKTGQKLNFKPLKAN